MLRILSFFRNPLLLSAAGFCLLVILSALLLQARSPGQGQGLSAVEDPGLCSTCHPHIYESWAATLHARNDVGCNSCHGSGIEHRRLPVKETLIRPENTLTCLKCHHEEDFSQADLEKAHPKGNRYHEMWKERLLGNFLAGRASRLELFLLPDCPYGALALQDILHLRQEYPNHFDLQLTWMGSPDEVEKVPEKVRYHLAVHSLYPDDFEEYLIRGLEMPSESPWEEAAGAVGLPTEELSSWMKSDEVATLLKWDFEHSEEKGIILSPTLFVGEYLFTGPFPGRSLRRLWAEVVGEPVEQLEECDTSLDCNWPWEKCLPGEMDGLRQCIALDASPVVLTLIDSLDCVGCYSDPVISSAMQLFPGLEVQWLDAGKPGKGKDLAEKLNLETLPAYIFDQSLKDTSLAFRNLHPILRETEEGWLVDPAVTASPLLWQRPREKGALELWFSPGRPASDSMEDMWREWLTAHPDRYTAVRVRFLLTDFQDALPKDFILEPTSATGALALLPDISPELGGLLGRYKKWGLGWEAFRRDLAVEGFPHPQSQAGGALVNNQVWIEGWSPRMISRVLVEVEKSK
jgi:hypothetical protein